MDIVYATKTRRYHRDTDIGAVALSLNAMAPICYNTTMKRLIFVHFMLITIAACSPAPTPKSSSDRSVEAIVSFENVDVFVEIADDPEEQRLGLSNRPRLAENHGMLFLYDTPRWPVFWMKDMQFPLDFIWIRENRIVDINTDVPPPPEDAQGDEIARISPDDTTTAVLEVNAGFVNRYRISLGDTVTIQRDDL